MASSQHYTSKRSKVLHIKDISVDPSSYVDPYGFLFHYENEIYRCIRAGAVPFYQRMMDEDILSQLEHQNNLVPTVLSDLKIAEEPEGIVLHHESIYPVSYCVEWCMSMLRDAALCTLDLAIDLVGFDLMLQDAYPWNVLFRGTKPVFVDITSIVPGDSVVIWPAHEQFESFFSRPIILTTHGKGKVTRALLFDNISGISLTQYYQLLSASYHVGHPGTAISYQFNKLLQKNAGFRQFIKNVAQKAMVNITPQVRRSFLARLRRNLTFRYTAESWDPWTKYYQQIGHDINKEAKLSTVRSLLEKLKPDTVLDIGCNTGVFSIEAARCGAQVISIDSSESCIEILYKTACKENMVITPLIVDILCSTPSFGFMGRQYPGFLERAKSDLVLCLGIMHHLHLSGRQSIERIAQLVEAATGRFLIFEFIDRADANIAYLPERRNIDYTLDSVAYELGKRFKKIDIIPSDRPTRNLLICEK